MDCIMCSTFFNGPLVTRIIPTSSSWEVKKKFIKVLTSARLHLPCTKMGRLQSVFWMYSHLRCTSDLSILIYNEKNPHHPLIIFYFLFRFPCTLTYRENNNNKVTHKKTISSIREAMVGDMIIQNQLNIKKTKNLSVIHHVLNLKDIHSYITYG